DPCFSPKICFRAIWRRNFAGGKRKRFTPAHLRAKTRGGFVSAGLFGGGANFGRESRYSNGLRRHFPAPRPRREESAERTAGAPAAGLSAGRHFRARIAGFQRLAAPFRGAMRLVAEPEPMRTAVALLEAFSHPAAFPLSASSTK